MPLADASSCKPTMAIDQSKLCYITRSVSLGVSRCSYSQIMKSDEDVRMISAEAPVVFAKVG